MHCEKCGANHISKSKTDYKCGSYNNLNGFVQSLSCKKKVKKLEEVKK